MAPLRVLIVEDDPVMAMHLETLVCDVLPSEVVVGASVATAEVAIHSGFDFALLDVDVTDGKTFDFSSSLVERGIPFAFVSASDHDEVPYELRDVPFIAKPYNDLDMGRLVGSFASNLDR